MHSLEPIVGRIRERWPNVRIPVRGDAGFCREKLMAWCEREGIAYIFGLAQNARLKKEYSETDEIHRPPPPICAAATIASPLVSTPRLRRPLNSRGFALALHTDFHYPWA